MKKVGLAIMVIGLVITLFTGFAYFTREKVVDIGSLEITANQRHDVEWSPLLGIVTAAVGAGLFFFSSRRAGQ